MLKLRYELELMKREARIADIRLKKLVVAVAKDELEKQFKSGKTDNK